MTVNHMITDHKLGTAIYAALNDTPFQLAHNGRHHFLIDIIDYLTGRPHHSCSPCVDAQEFPQVKVFAPLNDKDYQVCPPLSANAIYTSESFHTLSWPSSMSPTTSCPSPITSSRKPSTNTCMTVQWEKIDSRSPSSSLSSASSTSGRDYKVLTSHARNKVLTSPSENNTLQVPSLRALFKTRLRQKFK